ncbi:MAG: hypothetical protein RLN88_12970 [Ekhidna sp.]|uniref:hypothetical protein n=1 Tax=Ekhidna sp. TaxID=2608089 RepID=UPI0032ECAB64
MKKNIPIILLSITTLFFLLYAFIKADEAEKAGIMAEEQRWEAEKLRDQAMALQEAAQEAAAMARQVEAEARKALLECQSK